MNKYTLFGTVVLLIAAPVFAACGAQNTHPEAEAPEIVAPLPEPFEPLPQTAEENDDHNGEAQAQYLLVRANGLNVRSGAGVSFPVLGQAEQGVLLAYEGTEGGWHRTLYRGKTAYVSANAAYTEFFSLGESDARTEAVVYEGLRLLGTPYVYGATRFHDGAGHLLNGFSEEKFDCSSLMQYIFSRGAGIGLDVTTRTQIKQGVHVEESELRRGDLLFFTNASRCNKTGLERVGHVALYLGGNYILHTASDYAKAEPISAARRNYFLEARRVL